MSKTNNFLNSLTEVDVVILSLTNSQEIYEMTYQAIMSLINSDTGAIFNIFVVESNKDFFHKFEYYPHCKMIIPNEEFNYNKFCKIGLSYGKSEWVALCNNDLFFHPNWFSEILKVANMFPDSSSYSPWNPFRGWHDNLMANVEPVYNGVYEGYRTSYEIAGWCLVTRRTTFDTVNLDDRVSFWYSDNVYADELVKHGHIHYLVKASKVSHLCSATLRTMEVDVQRELTDGQRIKFLQGRGA